GKACPRLSHPLLPALLPCRPDVVRHSRPAERLPPGLEPSPVAEQQTPGRVDDPDLDPESPARLVVPLPHIRQAGEQGRKPESDPALVEALLARAQPEPALRVHREIDIDRQMLVRPQVVDDPPAPLAVDHVGVEAARPPRLELPDPGDGLAS